jgi:hypothetical protein
MILLIKARDITKNTPLGGNIDVDRYTSCLWDAQMLKLEPILGVDLYAKISTDFSTNNLTGLYLELYTNFIKPFLIHATAENYLLIGAYQIANGGIYKHTAENAESVTKEEVDYLVVNQRSKAEAYALRLNDWLCKNQLAEYKKCESKKYNIGNLWLGKNQ